MPVVATEGFEEVAGTVFCKKDRLGDSTQVTPIVPALVLPEQSAPVLGYTSPSVANRDPRPVLNRRQIAYLLLVVAPAMWSVNYLVARLAVGVIEPHLLAFLRWLFALALMLPFAWVELSGKWPDWKQEWRQFLLLGGLGMWICGAFVYIGAKSTPAINIGLLYALAPVFIAVASALLFGDRLRGIQWLGVALAFSGTVLIVAQGDFDNIRQLAFTAGDLWVLTAVLCWTAYSLLLMRRKSVLGGFARLTVITMGGLIVLIPFTLAEAYYVGLPAQWPYALVLAVLVAVFPGFGAYQAYSFMQAELGPARTGLVLYLGPIYAALLGWLLLHEPPQVYHVIGGLLIVPGMYFATRPNRSASRE